jgi:hypothetical protein
MICSILRFYHFILAVGLSFKLVFLKVGFREILQSIVCHYAYKSTAPHPSASVARWAQRPQPPPPSSTTSTSTSNLPPPPPPHLLPQHLAAANISASHPSRPHFIQDFLQPLLPHSPPPPLNDRRAQHQFAACQSGAAAPRRPPRQERPPPRAHRWGVLGSAFNSVLFLTRCSAG